jgi:hypothetical protein
MKLRTKLMLLALSAAGAMMQLGSCAQFWGDFLGDQLFFRQLD